jgi:hypothetical protein
MERRIGIMKMKLSIIGIGKDSLCRRAKERRIGG